MDPEMIKAIASLWLLALILLLAMGVVIFRGQLRNLLSRLTQFKVKRGETEVSVSQEPKKAETNLETPTEEQAATEKPSTETSDKIKKLEPKTSKEWLGEMIDAFYSRNIEQGEEAFKKVQESEADAVEKLKNEAIYLSLRYRHANDSSALRKLQALAEQRKEVSHYVHFWIGFCYEEAGEFDNAAKAYEISAQSKQKEKDRAHDIVSLARCLFRAGKQSQAYKAVMQEIGKATDAEAVSTLYEGLASLYELSQDLELRALALEKALESKPNDTKLHFAAAYSYSQKELNDLSLLHYKTSLTFNPDDAPSLNNIAVQYEQLLMPMHSVKFYKKASERNETLAMANLAYRFMNAGFREEASEILNKAKQQANLHPNVGSAISAIPEKEEAESEIEERSLNSARTQQRFLLSFAEAYFTEKPNCPTFNGLWCNSIDLSITQSETRIEARWLDDEENKFTGHVTNRAARVTSYKKNAFLSRYEENGRGYVYLSPDGQQLFIMILKEDKHSFLTLNKTE